MDVTYNGEAMYLGMEGKPHFSVPKIIAELKSLNFTHLIYLTDFMTGFLVDRLLEAAPEITLVTVCREGEALAVAAGLWMAGKKPIIMQQNSGFLDSGDTVTGISLELRTPILMLIGYRGFYHDRSKEKMDAPGKYIEGVLQAMDVPYEIIETDNDIPKITELMHQAETLRKPTVALIAWESPLMEWPASPWEQSILDAAK